MAELHGKNFIGRTLSGKGDKSFRAFDPASGDMLGTSFVSAVDEEIEGAMALALGAFSELKSKSQIQRAYYLENIAGEILSLGDELIERTVLETGLPKGRIEGERGRTCNQLKMFASLLRDGSWVEASIDTAIPDRQPVPKPDIRKMLKAIGPVVVFGASNFPLAFSVAGGDTASAFAAGNPVIVKAHPLHPGTSELIAGAIIRAAEKSDMPDGIFSMLHDSGYHAGSKLVTHPAAKAVGFTGSYAGGKALFDLVQKREEPIPFFGEMSATNPVIFLPSSQGEDASMWAESYSASLNLGAGQFCTNPGIAIVLKCQDTENFLDELRTAVGNSTSQVMLSNGIAENYRQKKDSILSDFDLKTEVNGAESEGANIGRPAIALVPALKFIENPDLADEVFGPFGLVVIADNADQLKLLITSLPGQLTASIIGHQNDNELTKELILSLTELAGRLIFNGMPTGVEVCHSMHHGGPFPATTDSRFTSVGTSAIKRFARPVAYQSCPQKLLPEELQDSNPVGIYRMVNGNWENGQIIQ